MAAWLLLLRVESWLLSSHCLRGEVVVVAVAVVEVVEVEVEVEVVVVVVVSVSVSLELCLVCSGLQSRSVV